MKTVVLILLSILLLSCQQKIKAPAKAELWQAHSISTALPEFATTINAQQDKVYFNRTTADRSSMQIMYSKKIDGNWKSATALPFSTGQYLDVDPFLTADGKRLYFSSDRPLVVGEEKAEDLDTWYVDITDMGWSQPIRPESHLNSDSTEIFVSMAKNGNAYFVSEFDGERGIVVSRFAQGQYQPMERIRLQLRGEVIYASNPCISYDERFIVVAARDGKETPPDLFISWNKKGVWSELQNLGPLVNSAYADFAPGLSKDNQFLYFTSERPGIVPAQEEGVRPPGDIYRVQLHNIK